MGGAATKVLFAKCSTSTNLRNFHQQKFLTIQYGTNTCAMEVYNNESTKVQNPWRMCGVASDDIMTNCT